MQYLYENTFIAAISHVQAGPKVSLPCLSLLQVCSFSRTSYSRQSTITQLPFCMYLFHLHNSLAPYIIIQGTFSDSLHMIKCCVSFYSIVIWGRGSRNEAISDVSEHSTTQSPGGKGSGTPSQILGQQVLESGHKTSVTKQQD